MKFLQFTTESKPEDALDLPEGRLIVSCFEASFGPENVVDCAELIIKSGYDGKFYSQAGVIKYAGNNLGWGVGEGYNIF